MPVLLLFLFLLPEGAVAARITVGVASNFAEVAHALGALFEKETAHKVRFSIGSTGALYAQIRNGAPYDLMLAADEARPARLVQEGRALPDGRFTYAIGRLVLWSPNLDLEDAPAVLRAGTFRHLAIANPDLAPYGLAARQTMEVLGVADSLQSKLVMGSNIGQAHTMVATGNAELGFVARSYLRDVETGSRWLVPSEYHNPIRQDAVILNRAVDNPAAMSFAEFLKSDSAREVIAQFGYDVSPAE